MVVLIGLVGDYESAWRSPMTGNDAIKAPGEKRTAAAKILAREGESGEPLLITLFALLLQEPGVQLLVRELGETAMPMAWISQRI